MAVYAIGLDLGFKKTGAAVFELTPDEDILVALRVLQVPIGKKDYVAKDMGRAVRVAMSNYAKLFEEYKPAGVFAELQALGARSANAVKHMSLGLAAFSAARYVYPDLQVEEYIATEIEKELGLRLKPGDAKKLGLKRGETATWKKSRLAVRVQQEFVSTLWPKWVMGKEDVFDAAAAFLCGRLRDDLYKEIKPCGLP